LQQKSETQTLKQELLSAQQKNQSLLESIDKSTAEQKRREEQLGKLQTIVQEKSSSNAMQLSDLEESINTLTAQLNQESGKLETEKQKSLTLTKDLTETKLKLENSEKILIEKQKSKLKS